MGKRKHSKRTAGGLRIKDLLSKDEQQAMSEVFFSESGEPLTDELIIELSSADLWEMPLLLAAREAGATFNRGRLSLIYPGFATGAFNQLFSDQTPD